ncbi:KH domain-containing protein [Apostasia shenzhenica]|uniref:KH domain-containing protein n=1 Tax=Apostasia shenzhenica TaxID=1088818 RepID=A0A2I0ATB3_9ASPA|nr:KH domain-containing protein [Apostasia shenzhenica]
MSTKVGSPSAGESRHGQSTASVLASSSVSAGSPKVSMFGAKSGFVIPKNKLSGSLVPIFRGGGKVESGSIVKEENTKNIQRKTKWGPDLTLDAAVRKGKALAYQTRVEQITQLLKSGSLELGDDRASQSPNSNSTIGNADIKFRKNELLELERRELIGEILRLNPSYKAPSDYKPLLKESKVPVPVKTYPGYNFISLLLGPESNTQKRLEEETGARVRLYGTKAGMVEKREMTKSDINEGPDVYEGLYVLVSADTYDKVDTAVSLIELLLTPVSGNAGVTPKDSTVKDTDIQDLNKDSSGVMLAPVASVIQTVPTPSSLPFQASQPSYPWFPPATPNSSSQPPSLYTPSLPPNNPGFFQPSLATALGMPQYVNQSHNFGSAARASPPILRPPPIHMPPNQSPSLPSSQPLTTRPPAPAPVNPQMGIPGRPLMTAAVNSSGWSHAPIPSPSRPNVNQMLPLSNTLIRPSLAVPSTNNSQAPFHHNVPENIVGRPGLANFTPRSAPLISQLSINRPIFTSLPTQIGIAPTPGTVSSVISAAHPVMPPQSNSGTMSSTAPAPGPTVVQMASSAPVGRPPIPLLTPSPTAAPNSVRTLMQPTHPPTAISISTPTSMSNYYPQNAANNTTGAPPVTAPIPPRPISGDFTFQPVRTHPPYTPSILTSSNSNVIQNNQQALFTPPITPSFRPALQITESPTRPPHAAEGSLHHAFHVSPFPASANSMRPLPPMLQGFTNPSSVPPLAPAIGRPSFPPTPQGPNPSSTMPAYPRNFQQPHQNLVLPVNRPGGNIPVQNQQFGAKPFDFMAGNIRAPPGGNQIYDPFSPTASAPPQPEVNTAKNNTKPEADAEYEDLMASVGVK